MFRSEVSLYELQCDIVLLLGTLGGRVNSLLITPQLPDICWSNETVLTVALPLGPALHNICLGNYWTAAQFFFIVISVLNLGLIFVFMIVILLNSSSIKQHNLNNI